ncbi:uncharacterized protein C6orf118 isoform X2 [Aplysia californica]|uniref:Uncharacterized protein C6orf118 isoform X2 n=1 Tax=Aplysia californica TaxID=6500 RepID=A0ABM0JBU7_APLCA|nr:uncharacterized protein C6orf118 isoform X2 [Aplysia californica]
MAFKFILSHHIKTILNDAEDKQKKDIKDFAGGHLNESVLLKAPIVLNRKPWASAHAKDVSLKAASKPQHKPRVKSEKGTPKEVLFDFSLGTAGVIPPVKSKVPKTPEVRYRLVPPDEKEGEDSEDVPSFTPKSLYSQLEDGVLIEELPPQELMMPVSRGRRRPLAAESGEDKLPFVGDSMFTSQTSFLSRRSDMISPLPFNYSLVPMHSKGLTRKDQYRRMKGFDATVLKRKELTEQKILSGEKAARHHEFKLEQDLEDLNLNGIGPNFHRLQVFSNVLEDVIDESPTFNYILRCVKTEYDNYIAKLLDGQTSQQHLLRDQVDQMASRGTSRPDDMAAAMEKLHSLEEEARQMLDMNQKLRDDVHAENELLTKTPENPARKTPPAGGYSRKEQPVELSLELENMKALILEKMDELTAMRVQLRDEFVPMTVCTHLEQCIKETEVEVQKLLKQNEYFERSIAEMDADLKEAIIEADTSEKDARRIWYKVNSTKGMPGQRQGTGTESDEDDDDESKWNWYIS